MNNVRPSRKLKVAESKTQIKLNNIVQNNR